MTLHQAELLLAAVIAARATSFLFSKILLVEMGPFSLMGLRFLLASLILALAFNRRLRSLPRQAVLHGLIVGSVFFATMAFELYALVYTDSGMVALLENLAIILVPLSEALLVRRFPNRAVAIAVPLAVGGVFCSAAGRGVFCSPMGFFGIGELLALGAAVCYTVTILLTARVAKTDDPLGIGIVQLLAMSAFSIVCAFLFEQPTLPTDGIGWASLVVLVVVCTGFGFTLQPVAQRYLSAGRAGLFCAITPLVASVLGMMFLGETGNVLTYAGIGFIVVAMVVANLTPGQEKVPEGSVKRMAPSDLAAERRGQ
ncbi:MAG: DMT family transporter [Eggerthellaceae bacterium]|jgi:drug/metabolite transporter (DMT)-like permease